MVRRHIFLVILLALAGRLVVDADTARANGLAADVSSRLIAITTAFVGGEVVVFGAIDDEDDDVVIILQGPKRKQMVRRKSRIAGIWVNRDRVAFDNVPSFFAIASNRSLDDIASLPVQSQFGLGVDYLPMMLVDGDAYTPEEREAFAEALVRNKQKAGLYTKEPGRVTFPGPKLFRTTFTFPASVPPGHYQVEVFKLKDSQVVGAQKSSLQISKVGLEADVFDFANERAALYGIIAIVIALTAGWLAGIIFRRA